MRVLPALLLLVLPLHASVIGVSKSTEPLTEARIRTLPAKQQKPWLDYLHRSEAQARADRAALARERAGIAELPPLPKQGYAGRSMPLHRAPEWYRGEEARRIGDAILSFQTPAGGWSKNLDFSAGPRLRGQSYATANAAPSAAQPTDFDFPRDEHWHYVGTLDNDATSTELHFLAALSAALPGREGDVYRASFLRGVRYLLDAQYPNGGWPQVWPLEGGYHDAVTFNDNAQVEATELLSEVAAGERAAVPPDADEVAVAGRASAAGPAPQAVPQDFTFVPAATRALAKAAIARSLNCILAAQVRLPAPAGKGAVLTVWAQQNDPLTLRPVTARNYEPEALSSGESAALMEYLMSLPRPSPAAVQAVNAAAAWFEAHKIMGFVIAGGRGQERPRGPVAQPGAGPLWSRYYSLSTGKPIFGDRDKTIHDTLDDISLERRNGYAWYGAAPAHALAEYATWKKAHPAA